MQNTSLKGVTLYGAALHFARSYWRLLGIKSISLAGSVAETGESKHDVDIILYVDNNTLRQYLAGAAEIENRYPHIVSCQKDVIRSAKYELICDTLGINRAERNTACFAKSGGIHWPLDIFLLPTDCWQGDELKFDSRFSRFDRNIIEPMKKSEMEFDIFLNEFILSDGSPLSFPVWSVV